MRASTIHRLEKLPVEDGWPPFVSHAFYGGNSNAHPQLEDLGREIVVKCDGNPFAVKVIGALLRSSLDVNEWRKVLESELWNSSIDETTIPPALRVSYKYLHIDLKRCFAYCSVFPKNYTFEKDQVILLWMAEGFLPPSRIKTMEEVGEDYFLSLVSRSLFQQIGGDNSRFVMHDLVNDLAKFVSGQFSFRLGVDHSHESVNKTRHLSYFRTEFETIKMFEALSEVKKLRTFLPLELLLGHQYLTKKVPHDLLAMFRCLRVLSLSHYDNVTELPESIGEINLYDI
jgi:hypothetical protein